MKSNIIMMVTAVAMSSCSLYRTFDTPVEDREHLCGEQMILLDSTSAVPSLDQMFQDEKLLKLIKTGLDSNSDLRIAQYNIEQAQATLLSSKLSYAPSVALGAEGSISSFDGASSSKTYTIPLIMQWEIDLFGKIRNNKKQAESILFLQKENEKMLRMQLVASIADTYYTLLMLDEQLRLAIESVGLQKKNLEVIRALKEAGMQTEAAVNQATANYYDVQSTVKDLEQQQHLVENALNLLINTVPQKIDRSSFSVSVALNNELPASISLFALSNRPDVKMAEANLSRSFYGVNYARSALYPSLVLGGTAGWTNNMGVILNPGSMLLSAVGSLTQPLFNRGVNRANLKIAKAQYEQSLIAFEKAILVAGNEVNGSLVEWQMSAERLELRAQQIVANKLAVSNSLELMKNSSVTYLEVLYAQNNLLHSQLAYVADWFAKTRGRINLYKSLGGGVE